MSLEGIAGPAAVHFLRPHGQCPDALVDGLMFAQILMTVNPDSVTCEQCISDRPHTVIAEPGETT